MSTVLVVLLWINLQFSGITGMVAADFSVIPQKEIDGLLSFYNATGGNNWFYQWNVNLIYSQQVCIVSSTRSSLRGITCHPINQTHSMILQINFFNNNLIGTIPNQIENFKQRTMIKFENEPGIIGEIPSTLSNLRNLNTLWIRNISITGNLSNIICNILSSAPLSGLSFHYTNISGIIPKCISNLIHLTLFDLKVNPNIYGAIPDGFCNLHRLFTFRIQYSRLTGSIPHCLLNTSYVLAKFEVNGNALTGMITAIPLNTINFQISDNEFYGTLPPFPSTTNLSHFSVYNNKLHGYINKVFQDLSVLKYIEGFTIFNNDFGGDISNIFRYLFLEASNLGYIGTQNNPKLTGSIPDFNENVDVVFHGLHGDGDGDKGYFMVHNCDIYGSIPQNVQFHNLSYLTLYKNRLSCNIPSNFIPNINNLFEVVLPNNLFRTTHNTLPEWINSPFRRSKSLYFDQATIIRFYCIAILAFCLFAILCLDIIWNKFQQKHRQLNNKNDSMFFNKIDDLINVFCDLKLLILSITLIIIYSLNANYYSCVPFLSRFTLSYYYPLNEFKFYINWMLIVLWCTMISMLAHKIFRLSLKTNLYGAKSSVNLNDSNSLSNNIYADIRLDIELENITCLNKLWIIIQFIFVLCCFIFGIIALVIYAMAQSLSSDNYFGLTEYQLDIIRHSVALILAINSSIVIPKLIDKFHQIFWNNFSNKKLPKTYLLKYRAIFIIILRSFAAILIPFFSSVILLSDCMNCWAEMWDICINDPNIFYIDVYPIGQAIETTALLTPNQICYPQYNLLEINWNKCFRQFYSKWSIVMIEKVIIMIFMPITIILLKSIKQWIVNKIYNEYEPKRITVDMEFAMILTKIEILISYSLISPLIVPLCLLSLKWNVYCYKLMVQHDMIQICRSRFIYWEQWILYPFDKDNYLPIQYLWLGFAILQLFTLSYTITAFGIAYIILLAIVFVFIDIFLCVAYAVHYYHTK